ncbi:UPF0160 protein MYG1, mitochondrial isoform X1 [Histomonas meleagridis]|uniref:UPF0160 protein MYG1, mitochondrial isoform X1 n=1 Tax=Histomonas meleagridis TaxID=135588 RepID=UPI0035597DE3|nr:UPF0160 protein MYG1, mitochondrial isoform X1 [Histomonas meleagridis]KAH0796140.1 UPF0160 protein MYG1, mitochondrial isoform X1 [Histomonas meleagridis]
MKKIAVHSESFHADDAISVYLLKHTAEFKDAEIIRTRDMNIINQCDAAADVGCEYDHEKRRYDHHQQGFDVKFPGSNIRCAAAGLVYIHFGKEVLQNLIQKFNLDVGNYFDFVYNAMYYNFIQEIDAIDNGISIVDEQTDKSYNISSDISSRVAILNPHWRTPNPNPDLQFTKAIQLVGDEFETLLKHVVKHWIEGFATFKEAYENRFNYDKSGKIIFLPNQPFVHYFLREFGDDFEGVFFVAQNNKGCSVKSIPYFNQPFKYRKYLPFAGEDPKEIEKKTNTHGVLFSHKSGFLIVYSSEEEAHKFAKFALEN